MDPSEPEEKLGGLGAVLPVDDVPYPSDSLADQHRRSREVGDDANRVAPPERVDRPADEAAEYAAPDADATVPDGEDPAGVARAFQQQGARMLHLVDLDGAFRGASGNRAAIEAIRAAVSIPLEVGGGMRAFADISDMLAMGVDSVIIGTMAVENPHDLERALGKFGPESIQLGIDARKGRVAVKGWREDTSLEAVSFALAWKAKNIQRAIFTDIARDGMLQGPNPEAIRDFAEGSGLKVTASGGVSSAEDVAQLAGLEPVGVDRVIIGKALYEGTIRLSELL